MYVINKNGNPLMPCKEAKARHLLRDKKAKVVKKLPFTIQLLFDCEENVQPISLGIDAGSKHIGVSATTENKVLYEADVELRNDIVDLISTKREARRTRRNRKTRYRKARFDNRKREEGWLSPSVRQKIETHLQVVRDVYKILPVFKIIVETASFDIQKIKNPDIQGEEYQHGDQLNFWNTREYVLWRDSHTCQCCKGKSGDKILNVHHIESRKTGGDAPNNLITLCDTCHTGYHKGSVMLPKNIKRDASFKDAAFMGIMGWTFYGELKKNYPNVHTTFGYITKGNRIKNGLPKDHFIDARCISGNPLAKTSGTVYYQKKVRRHNRKIYKDKILKGGIIKRNQCSYEMFGFHRYDLVKWNSKLCYVNSLRMSGRFQIKDLIDKDFKKEISYKKIDKVQNRNGFITSFTKVV